MSSYLSPVMAMPHAKTLMLAMTNGSSFRSHSTLSEAHQTWVIFESGGPEGQYYCYILLRVFAYDGVGHSALEVKIHNPSTPPYKRLAHFYILGEAATFNRLGQSLEEWVRSKEPQFVFSTAAA
jgi:hypothetical protein